MSALKDFCIPFKGYKSGEHHLEFTIDKALLEELGDEEMIDAQVDVDIVMTKAAQMLTFEVALDGVAKVECDR